MNWAKTPRGTTTPGRPEASLTAHPDGNGRCPVDLRRFFFEWAGNTIPRHYRVYTICGEPRCLNTEHMHAGAKGHQTVGQANAERRAEIAALCIESLDAKRKAKSLTYEKIGQRYGLSRQRIQQIFAFEVGVEINELSDWIRDYLNRPPEKSG